MAIQTVWFIISSTTLMTHCIRHRMRLKHVALGNPPASTDKLGWVVATFPWIGATTLICFCRAVVQFWNILVAGNVKDHCFLKTLRSLAFKVILILIFCTPHCMFTDCRCRSTVAYRRAWRSNTEETQNFSSCITICTTYRKLLKLNIILKQRFHVISHASL
jgi:hypothetical protein